jgi:hypothetical protein
MSRTVNTGNGKPVGLYFLICCAVAAFVIFGLVYVMTPKAVPTPTTLTKSAVGSSFAVMEQDDRIQFVNWDKVLVLAKGNGHVTMAVRDIEEAPPGECAVVYLVDGNKEYVVGPACFYPVGIKKSSFGFQIDHVLANINSLSSDTFIRVRDTKGNLLNFGVVEVKVTSKQPVMGERQ